MAKPRLEAPPNLKTARKRVQARMGSCMSASFLFAKPAPGSEFLRGGNNSLIDGRADESARQLSGRWLPIEGAAICLLRSSPGLVVFIFRIADGPQSRFMPKPSGSNRNVKSGATLKSTAPGCSGPGAGERILTTATQLFARFGYNGVSTRDVAAAAEVNEVTVYRHYRRKPNLYLAVLESELRSIHFRGDLLARIAAAGNGRDALACTFDLVADTLLERPETLRLLQFNSLEMNEAFNPLVRQHLGELVEVVARYLAPWIDKANCDLPMHGPPF